MQIMAVLVWMSLSSMKIGVRDFEGDRFNTELVEFVETHPNECGDLAVVIIPEEATDWEMDECDGWESVIYVLNGKIVHAECEED